MDEAIGTVRVAPGVLTTIVTETALACPGVAELAGPPGRGPRLGRGGPRGLKVEVRDDAVYVELYVVARSGTNLLDLGRRLQHDVARAIETMVGLPVYKVDVYVEDVR